MACYHAAVVCQYHSELRNQTLPRRLFNIGVNCQDTKAFVKAANMVGFQTLLRGCKSQLEGSGIDFDKIDYGFSWKHSFPLTWAAYSTGQKGGVGFGLTLAIIFALGIFVTVFGVSASSSRSHGTSTGSYELPRLSPLPSKQTFTTRDYEAPAPAPRHSQSYQPQARVIFQPIVFFNPQQTYN
jgi:hypothetical protein